MSTITPVTNATRNAKNTVAVSPTSVLLDRIGLKQKIANYKLAKAWEFRNMEHGEVFLTSLEVEHLVFLDDIFIEDSKEMSARLARLGFEDLTGFPDEENYNEFSRVMYHRKHNIAVNLYKPSYKTAIYTADRIIEESEITGLTATAVFISTIKVLTSAK